MSKRITTRYRVVYDDDGLTPLPGFLHDWEPISFSSNAVTYAPDERVSDEETERTRFRALIQPKKQQLAEEKAERERIAAEEEAERERIKAEEKAERERIEEEEMLGGV